MALVPPSDAAPIGSVVPQAENSTLLQVTKRNVIFHNLNGNVLTIGLANGNTFTLRMDSDVGPVLGTFTHIMNNCIMSLQEMCDFIEWINLYRAARIPGASAAVLETLNALLLPRNYFELEKALQNPNNVIDFGELDPGSPRNVQDAQQVFAQLSRISPGFPSSPCGAEWSRCNHEKGRAGYFAPCNSAISQCTRAAFDEYHSGLRDQAKLCKFMALSATLLATTHVRFITGIV